MANIYNLFRFLEKQEGTKIPFKVKFVHAPDTLTPDDLKVKGSLNLYNTPITSLPDGLEVGGYLDLRNTPLSKKYTKEEIRKMIEDKGGNIEYKILI